MPKEIVDLEPFESGKEKMYKKCDSEGCDFKKDITKEYISMEKENNKRRKAMGDEFDPACDELAMYLMGFYCHEHRWEGSHWICKYCHDAKFMEYWDLCIHQLVCSHKRDIPKDMNWWDWFRSIDWSKKEEKYENSHFCKDGACDECAEKDISRC